MRILASPAFSNRQINPYNWLLYTHMTQLGVEVQEYSWERLLTGAYDIWHIHWPEAPLNDANPLRSTAQMVKLLAMMRVARRRGVRLVWTVHNLAAHEEQHPRLAPWFWKGFIKLLDGYLSLSNAGQRLAIEKFAALAEKPGFIVPLGHFRGVYPNGSSRHAARQRLGLETDAVVLAFVGQVRRYKGVLELCNEFTHVADPDARLLVAGDPRDWQLEREVHRVAGNDARIRLHMSFIPDRRLQLYYGSADLVVLPFRAVLNSASALLALSFDRPILVPETGSFLELRDRVGREWVLTYRGPLTSVVLSETIEQARQARTPPSPVLDSLGWPVVARLAADALYTIMGAVPPQTCTAPVASARVSVVIPVYNREVQVRRAIESVLRQTYQDFEIVVVDDGSTDGTAASVAAVADPRVRLIRHERNRGGSAARNTGIRASSGEFVAFLDSDDEWLPTKLARQMDAFSRAGERVALNYTGAERIQTDGLVKRYIPQHRYDLTRALLTANVIGETSLGMVRRTALDEVGGFDETLPSFQDMDLWLRLSERFHIECIGTPLARVFKPHAPDRISENAHASTRGRELFFRKHLDKLVDERVLHIFLRDSAWIYLRRARDPDSAWRLYRASVGAMPFAPLTYLHLLLACLPIDLLDCFAQGKRSLLSWTRRHVRRQSWASEDQSSFAARTIAPSSRVDASQDRSSV